LKLIIQIPCLNEAETIGVTLAALPRSVDGFDTVEWLIVDDGSSDNTIEVAEHCGVDHIVRHKRHRGLARAFMSGLQECIRLGADVIVNTDADNQYNSADIPRLVAPIIEGRAEIVVGARPITEIQHFSKTKKILQRFGSWMVRQISFTDVPDTTSGFRAITKDAARQTMVFSEYTYTLETIIQAGHKKLSIESVPIRVNEDVRPSRLLKSIPSYIRQSLITVIRIYVIYRPFHFFGSIGIVFFVLGLLIGLRFFYYYLMGSGSGHIQSLILMSVLLGMGFQTMLIAFVADLFSANRKILEDIRYSGVANVKQREDQKKRD
jgi:glycosyltransferase involved in cell wall biosynthesis